MLDKIDFYKKDLKHIRYLTQAGGKLNLQINKKIIENLSVKKDFMLCMAQQKHSANVFSSTRVL